MLTDFWYMKEPIIINFLKKCATLNIASLSQFLRQNSPSLLNDPRVYIYIYIYIYTLREIYFTPPHSNSNPFITKKMIQYLTYFVFSSSDKYKSLLNKLKLVPFSKCINSLGLQCTYKVPYIFAHVPDIAKETSLWHDI